MTHYEDLGTLSIRSRHGVVCCLISNIIVYFYAWNAGMDVIQHAELRSKEDARYTKQNCEPKLSFRR